MWKLCAQLIQLSTLKITYFKLITENMTIIISCVIISFTLELKTKSKTRNLNLKIKNSHFHKPVHLTEDFWFTLKRKSTYVMSLPASVFVSNS